MVWHTQGSGKSLTMAFYAERIVREPALANPTVVVLTDRNDLDDQLFTIFVRCADLLRQPPVQAASRADLRAKLAVESGGVVFTTIQRFFPERKGDCHPLLADRRNIVVIADEAHRSQCDFIDGYVRHMRDALPNASFIGFTGTPIKLADASTRAVFGDHISVYDIQRVIADEAWRDDDGTRGALKVVMTGQASDTPDWQQHIGNKACREALVKQFRDPADPLRMVLVCDMWLIGFDAPSLHTVCVDKPMHGHGLM